jgi:DNA polymerase-3 subunit epsilon
MTSARRLRAWWHAHTARTAAGDERWVVVDTETSGLDPVNARLLAIGAVAVDRAGIRLGDSFELLLQNLAPGDKANVLIHGIGYEAQRNGVPPAQALSAFVSYVAAAPCVGFQCQFDRVVLAKSSAGAGVPVPLPRWLDLAPLAAALMPDVHRRGGRSLDDWLAAFDIGVVARHSAAGDALATAELLLRLRALAVAQGAAGFDALVRLSRHHRWLGGARF